MIRKNDVLNGKNSAQGKEKLRQLLRDEGRLFCEPVPKNPNVFR